MIYLCHFVLLNDFFDSFSIKDIYDFKWTTFLTVDQVGRNNVFNAELLSECLNHNSPYLTVRTSD